jgi:Trk K+ transport system NAD-binding subunit
MVDKSLNELNLAGTCNVNVLALTHRGVVTLHPAGNERLQSGDELIVAGFDGDLERIPGRTVR